MCEQFSRLISSVLNLVLERKVSRSIAVGVVLGICASVISSVQKIPYDKKSAALLLSEISNRSGIFRSPHAINVTKASSMISENSNALFWMLLDQNVLQYACVGALLAPAILITYRGILKNLDFDNHTDTNIHQRFD